MKFILPIILIYFLVSNVSCMSFRKKFNAEYSYTSIPIEHFSQSYSNLGKVESHKFPYSPEIIHFTSELDRKVLKKSICSDPIFLDKIKIEIIDPKNLTISSYLIDSTEVKTHIKYISKNGFLYLKNKNTKIALIPYLFGGVDIKKLRITLTPENDLYVETVSHQSAAVGFIGFLKVENNYYSYVLKNN